MTPYAVKRTGIDTQTPHVNRSYNPSCEMCGSAKSACYVRCAGAVAEATAIHKRARSGKPRIQAAKEEPTVTAPVLDPAGIWPP